MENYSNTLRLILQNKGFIKEELEFVEIYRLQIHKILLRVMIDDEITVFKLNTIIHKDSLENDDTIVIIKSIHRHYNKHGNRF